MAKHPLQHNGKYLHRIIWKEHHGPIPENHDIHHIDGDVRNNDIENLECLKHRDHTLSHLKYIEKNCDYCGASFIDRSINQLGRWCSKKCREDYRWSKHVPYQGINRNCAYCGIPYIDRSYNKLGKFCSKKCKQASYRARKSKSI